MFRRFYCNWNKIINEERKKYERNNRSLFVVRCIRKRVPRSARQVVAAVDVARRRRRRYHTITATANGVSVRRSVFAAHIQCLECVRTKTSIPSTFARRIEWANRWWCAFGAFARDEFTQPTIFSALLLISSESSWCGARHMQYLRRANARFLPDRLQKRRTWFVAVEATWVDATGDLTTFIV